MNRTLRRTVFAIVFIVVFVIVGTVGGFFDVFDVINRVSINTVDNDYGGVTFTKVTQEDKVVSWPSTYEKDFLPTIDDQKSHLYIEESDEKNEIFKFYFVYFSDRSVDDISKFYADHYGDTSIESSERFTYLTAYRDGYTIEITIDNEGDRNEVRVQALFE